MNTSEKLPVYFIPHGGGPWHVMDDASGDPEGYGKLKEYLEDLGRKFKDRIKMGKALEPLRKEGVLIIGSGMSYHNMQGFMSGTSSAASVSKHFDNWLTQSVEKNSAAERNELLINWERAPKARESHPRSEHLLPLFVIAGAAGDDTAVRDYSGLLMGINISGYKFG